MGIATGISHLFESVVEVFQGIFAAIVHAFQFVLSLIVGVFQSFVHFIEGTLGFAIHNFFILGTLAAAVLAYLLLAQKNQVPALKTKST